MTIEPCTFDRQRKLKTAAAPTVAQQRLRLRHATVIASNTQDATSRKMAGRLIDAWGLDDMIALAIDDLSSTSAFLRREARRFLELVAPDRLAKAVAVNTGTLHPPPA